MRKWTILAAALALTTSAFAASNPFSDVSRTHWAYSAIQRAVDAGILQGFDGKFHGDKLVNRYQMAVIVKKILDAVASRGGPAAAGMNSADIRNLEQLTIEFADELALLNVKVSTLEDSFAELRNQVDNMKYSSPARQSSGGGIGNAFTGFVAVALASTDDGTCNTCVAGSPGALTRWTGGTADQTFFTIPQASIGLDTEVGDGIGLHVQYDYSTDAPNGVGGGVGLNEAYLFVDELFGDIGGKIGGFAMPLQSWEINGAFRSSDMTITPSSKNTFLEGFRIVGLELTKTKDVDPTQVRWHLGLFNAGDIGAAAPGVAIGTAPGLVFPSPSALGFQSDAAGLGALTGTATFDDSFGFYLDVESGDNPDKNWGWRFGYFDLGGDNTAGAGVLVPVAGLGASQEISGWQVGFWWKNDNIKVIMEYLTADNDLHTAPGSIGSAQSIELHEWYLLLNWKMNDDTSVSLRYDQWSNAVAPVGGFEGDSFTLAWNRRISDTSMFQFEYISPDVEPKSVAGEADTDDDLIQFRYKVWF